MTSSRGLALGVLVAVVAVGAYLVLHGAKRHEYMLLFQTAGQLVKDNDVQVGGRRIGKVSDIQLTDNNLAEVTIEVEEPYAPLHQGTTATIRSTSLSGQANRYVALSPGPNSAAELDDDSTLALDKTTTSVDLDQLFDTLDPKTRKALQNVIRGSSTQYGSDGKKANAALEYLNPALSTTTQLVDELNRDQQAFEDFVVQTAKASTALAARKDELTDLVGNAGSASSAIADDSSSLDQALQALPGTLRNGNTTFVNLRAALDDLDKLVDATKPVAPKLAPFLRQLRPLVQDAQPTIKDLRTLITTPGARNDLTDLLKQQPGVTRVATPALSDTSDALQQSTPVLTFARPYAPDLIGWFRDFGQTTANYDANGHYARVSPVVDAFSFNQTSATTGTLTARPGGSRTTGTQARLNKRCPGSAETKAADGSNPSAPAGSDCDPTIVVPGP